MKKISFLLIILVIAITALLYYNLPKEQKFLSLTLGVSLLLGVISVITTLYNNSQIELRNEVEKIESTRPRFSITSTKNGNETQIEISYDCPKKITLDMFHIDIENGESWDSTSIATSRVKEKLSKNNGKLMLDQVLQIRFPDFNGVTFLERVQDKNNEMKLKIDCRTYYGEKIIYYLGHNLSQHYVDFNNGKVIEKALDKNLKYSFYKKWEAS
ncbi:hypothetical protein QI274_09155 [Staphylococcus saprophyticus]|nr:hypothetical protein [Staphylococcus saprophyticus]MDW4082748.1 hypothetical protein [Staphylococcus saprophyticus]